jgi:hypothetical protein
MNENLSLGYKSKFLLLKEKSSVVLNVCFDHIETKFDICSRLFAKNIFFLFLLNHENSRQKQDKINSKIYSKRLSYFKNLILYIQIF